MKRLSLAVMFVFCTLGMAAQDGYGRPYQKTDGTARVLSVLRLWKEMCKQ